MTPNQVIQLIETNLADNGVGSITPAIMRMVLEAIVGMSAPVLAGPPLASVLLYVEARQPGATAFMQASLPPDPGDPINICWNHGFIVTPPDPLRPTSTGYLWRFIASMTGLDMPTVVYNASQVSQ